MTKTFAEILRDHLGPQAAPAKADTPFRATTNSPFESYIFLPNLERNLPPRPTVNQIYRVPKKVRPAPENSTVQVVKEQFFAAERLEGREFLALKTLIRLGAGELTQGFSVANLKAAHRRLAKKLHPDVSPTTAQEFRELRAAYQTLNQFSLAAGSESASASTCPRQAAA